METTFVDIRDKELMISLGIHPRDAAPRDPSVWTKTPEQKKAMKRNRRKYKNFRFSKAAGPIKHIPIYDKLIVHIKADPLYAQYKNANGSPHTGTIKTTHTFHCAQSDIPFILSNFVDSKGNNIVTHYHWNHKKYEPTVLPFWYW